MNKKSFEKKKKFYRRKERIKKEKNTDGKIREYAPTDFKGLSSFICYRRNSVITIKGNQRKTS